MLQLGLLLLLSCLAAAQVQVSTDILGSHNMGAGTSPVKSGLSAACLYCHAPHSGIGGRTPLWSQKLSAQSYTMYSSTTMANATTQPTLGATSSLCLSCHDGTVAVGSVSPYGPFTMTGSMAKQDIFGTNLGTSHPFSLRTPLVDSPNLVASLAASGTTADPLQKVKLINGTVECNSCHEPHNQYLDPMSSNFLARDSVNGQLCLACHTSDVRTVNGKTNPLAQWSSSVHANSGNVVNGAAGLGSYNTVAQFACLACHTPHNANGASSLLRAAVPPSPAMDVATQDCMTCHNGSNLQSPIANVYAEFSKTGPHLLPAGTNLHDANEPAVLVNNRHATCADCHNAHSSFQVTSFAAPPNVRVSQTGSAGVSATDGTTVVSPVVNQYENCLRCHGTSPGKQVLAMYGYLPMRLVNAADPLNVIPQMSATSTSSHPVLHTPNAPLSQPSLMTYMLNLDGITNSTRGAGLGGASQIFCTDCHNSDDNREFGGSGPNGPHGSQYGHVLERRYEFSQVAPAAGPGTLIQNLFPNPNLNAGGGNPGPYALCGKCHNLGMTMGGVLSDATFQPDKKGLGGHFTHVSTDGISCSVCHTAHGMGALSANVTGERLVNFDINVVAPYKGNPISYNRGTNTCTLLCHGKNHLPNGNVQ